MRTAALVACLALTAVVRAEDDAAFFTKSVQPILQERCYSCHGPEKQKGKLRLDSRDAVLAGGKHHAAAVSGKPDESLLIKAVKYQDEDLQMPPKKKLSDEQIATLVEWVKRGLPWAGAEDKDKGKAEDKDKGKEAPKGEAKPEGAKPDEPKK